MALHRVFVGNDYVGVEFDGGKDALLCLDTFEPRSDDASTEPTSVNDPPRARPDSTFVPESDDAQHTCRIEEEKTLSVATLYPFLSEGIRHSLRLERVVVWESGMEAQIEALNNCTKRHAAVITPR